MAEPRKRRIVASTALALLVAAALIAWFNGREAPEVERSLGLRIGMTQADVEAVMGESRTLFVERYAGDDRITMLFGQSVERKEHLYDTLRTWTGELLPGWSVPLHHWPVRVRLNRRGGHVDRIERGDEVIEASPRQPAQ